MSTRCRIGLRNEDGSITSIYCHNDGYPSYVGEVLVKNYKTEDKIKELLALGDLSGLGTEPVDNPNAWAPYSSGKYSELHPDNMCDTYKSRGENCPAKTSRRLDDYLKLTGDSWGEYAYLFEDVCWYIVKKDVDGSYDFKPVEDELSAGDR